jgi:predicted MFS family arabinose efflux permease
MSVGFVMLWFAHDYFLLCSGVTVTSIGNGLNTPSLSSLISRAASGHEQGGVLGVSQSCGALARVAGPLVGTAMLGFGVAAPYVTGGIAMFAACVFALAAVRQPSTA